MFHGYGHQGTLRLPLPAAPDSQLDVWTQHMDGWCMDAQLVLRQAWHGTSFWLKVSLTSHTGNRPITDPRAPSQYPKRRISVRSRKVSKPRDLYLESSDRSEIWQALRQQCCRCACQISKRSDNLKYQSRGFETLRYLTKRRLFGYWDGALVTLITGRTSWIIENWVPFRCLAGGKMCCLSL